MAPGSDHGGSYTRRITAEGPCPLRHHPRSILPLASCWLPRCPRPRAGRGCCRYWPRSLIPAPAGVRHRLAAVLGLALCAILAGARSFIAIAKLAAHTGQATREALGVAEAAPLESAFRRTLQALDADALDEAAGWAQQRTAPAAGTRRAVTVDGKTLRGSGVADGPGRNLLAALDHRHGVVLGQVDVEAKTNEIPMFATVLDRID